MFIPLARMCESFLFKTNVCRFVSLSVGVFFHTYDILNNRNSELVKNVNDKVPNLQPTGRVSAFQPNWTNSPISWYNVLLLTKNVRSLSERVLNAKYPHFLKVEAQFFNYKKF